MNLFFELLQLALGTRDRLSAAPSAEEWSRVHRVAQEQAVAGICLVGLDRLPAEQRPPKALLLQWIGESEIIRQRNVEMDAHCVELLQRLEEAGLRASILKGRGIAKLYGAAGDLRQSGDIDVFVDGGRESALQKMAELGLPVERWDYKHAHVRVWQDTEMELHYRVDFMYGLSRNRKLQDWFEEHKEMLFERNGAWVTPSLEFNLFYILLHIYRHFFSEGVGLRQITDYYYVLKAARETQSASRMAIDAVEEFGMKRFARGLMWVIEEVLATPRELMPWEPDADEGRFILDRVMEGGNFGHYSSNRARLKGRFGIMLSTLRHSLHLLRRYPSEALSAPIWLIWHRLWRLKNRE